MMHVGEVVMVGLMVHLQGIPSIPRQGLSYTLRVALGLRKVSAGASPVEECLMDNTLPNGELTN